MTAGVSKPVQNREFGQVSGNVAVTALIVGVSMLYPLNLAAQTAGGAVPSSASAAAADASVPGASGTVNAAPAPAAGAAAADAGPDASVEGVQDVVINARKRTENLQEIPAPITYVSGEQLQQDNIQNIRQFQQVLPSFSYAASNPKQTNIGVRGIGNNGGNNDGIDPSVGVFVDGIYAGRLGEVTSNFNDLESIVLLRGPQGTLFGKNTIGGALLINSQAPSFTPGAVFETSLGTYDLNEFKGNATGTVVDGIVAARVAAYYTKQDGYITNIYNGSNYAQQQGEGVRGQLLITPNQDLTIRLIAEHDDSDFNLPTPVTYGVLEGSAKTAKCNNGIPTGGNLQTRMECAGYTLLLTNPYDRKIDYNNRASAATDTTSLTGQVDWNVGYGTVTSLTGYRDWHFHPYNDNDGTQLDAIRQFGTTNSVQTYTEELRWASPKGSRLESVVGLYFYDQVLAAVQAQILGSQYYIYAGNKYPTGTSWGSNYTVNDNSEAAFAHTIWHITDLWSLTAGLRWTDESKAVDWRGYALGNTPVATVNAINGGNFVSTVNNKAKDGSPGAELGTSYQVTDNVLGYVLYSHGSVAKGINAPALTNATALKAGGSQIIQPENADAIELGVKTGWFQNRLVVNGDIYDEYVANYQTTQAALAYNNGVPTSTTFLANVGSVISRGVELQVAAKPANGWLITAWGAYNNAEYGSFHDAQCPQESGVAAVCNLTGKQVPFTPLFSSDIRVEYEHPIGNGANAYAVADWNWRSSQNDSLQLDPHANIKPYGIVNLRIGARLLNEKLDLSLFGNNLFNANYLITNAYNATTKTFAALPGAPLTVGFTARVKF
jgi:iron complex outermembrane receptor protein